MSHLGKTKAQRFWSKVAIGHEQECWIWRGAKNKCGYGSFAIGNRRPALAHRVSYELSAGVALTEQQVLHRCDTPACVNPSHLFLGNHADNMADMKAKGRADARRGVEHYKAKLDRWEVLAIRHDPRGVTVIAADYGMSKSNISAIRHRKIWRSLPELPL